MDSHDYVIILTRWSLGLVLQDTQQQSTLLVLIWIPFCLRVSWRMVWLRAANSQQLLTVCFHSSMLDPLFISIHRRSGKLSRIPNWCIGSRTYGQVSRTICSIRHTNNYWDRLKDRPLSSAVPILARDAGRWRTRDCRYHYYRYWCEC